MEHEKRSFQRFPPFLHRIFFYGFYFFKNYFFSFKNELFPIFHRKETTAMMKFSCEKALLQSAIAVTSRAVAQKSSIPALEGLLLRAGQELTVSGYNMNTGI